MLTKLECVHLDYRPASCCRCGRIKARFLERNQTCMHYGMSGRTDTIAALSWGLQSCLQYSTGCETMHTLCAGHVNKHFDHPPSSESRFLSAEISASARPQCMSVASLPPAHSQSGTAWPEWEARHRWQETHSGDSSHIRGRDGLPRRQITCTVEACIAKE